jgi:hypothetical protein
LSTGDPYKEKIEAMMSMLGTKPQPLKPPTSEKLIAGITRQGVTLTPEEAAHERDTTTASDYDDWIMQALRDLCKGRIRAGEGGESVEHPLHRLHRIGEESILEGKESALYLRFKELVAEGYPVPTFTNRSMKTAQSRLDIANSYLQHLAKHLESPPLRHSTIKESAWERGDVRQPKISLLDAKKEFKRKTPSFSTSAIDRALKAHDLDFPAYGVDSPRKEKRKRK